MPPWGGAGGVRTPKGCVPGMAQTNGSFGEFHGFPLQNLGPVGEGVWQGSKVPVPNRRLVPGSREKRGKTGKNREKRGKTGKNGGKRGKNGGKQGKTGEIWGGGYFGQDPPTQILPPPTFIIMWGAFFANQIEAKGLSRVRHPSPKG